MGLVESLAAWGIVRPAEVVELAAAEGIDVACAATMLERESGGGRNVWGHDGVSTGGAYVKGAAVTREAYLEYRREQDAGRIGAQGVGPTQLTYPPLQRQADAIGGCWDWRANVRIGFRQLRALQHSYGVRDGFRRYNGSGPAAERYADDSMAELARWRARLGATSSSSAPAPPTPTGAAPRDELDMTPDELRAIVREEIRTGAAPAVWAALIPDYYTPDVPGQPADGMPAWVALGYAVSHAAHAGDNAAAARDQLEQLPARLAELVNARAFGAGAPITADDVSQLLTAALAEAGPLYLTTRPKEIPR